MKSNIVFILLFFLFISSCKKEHRYTNTFIGMYQIWDKECPYPYILNNENNHLYLINNKGITIDSASWKKDSIAKNDTIQFHNHELFFAAYKDQKYSVYDLKDSTRFLRTPKGLNYKFGAFYKQLLETPNFDINHVKELLVTNIWNYQHKNNTPNRDLEIKYKVSFDEHIMTQITSYFYDKLEVYQEIKRTNYHLFEVSGSMFLSFLAGENDDLPIFQITNVTKDQIEWNNFSHRDIAVETLSTSNQTKEDFDLSLVDIPNFELCLNKFQGSYYFREDVTYDYGNQYLVDKIGKNAPKAMKDGYINVHFFINCNGDLGQLGLEQMDKSFKPMKYNKEIVAHIIKELVQLKEWPSTFESVDHTDYKDVHAFLMFKIREGKIVDLCP